MDAGFVASTGLYILASILLWHFAKRESRDEVLKLREDLKRTRREKSEAYEQGYRAGATTYSPVKRTVTDLFRDTT